MLHLAVLLCLLLVPTLASAWDYAVGDATGLVQYLMNKDPSEVVGLANANQIPEAQTQAQRTFLQESLTIQTAGRPDIRKVRVVGGLAVAKTAADIAAIDQADAQAAAEQQVLKDEKATNPACNITSLQDAQNKLDAIKGTIQASIDASTTIATAKTAMGTINTEMMKVHTFVIKCLFAIGKSGG